MNIKSGLVLNAAIDIIKENPHLLDIELDADKIADTAATKMISEIQNALINSDNDFDTAEQIICIFEKYHVDCGDCHDFG